MKTLKSALLIALATTIFAVNTTQAANINERERAQRQSIRAGVEDGSLTGKEAKRLGKQQVKMERKEQRFRSDGELTRRERANLHATADANRARIYRQRHDDQVQQQ
jgi:hypothetical protein